MKSFKITSRGGFTARRCHITPKHLSMKSFKITIIILTALMGNLAFAATPKVVAHRGHWTPEGSAQNSIRSLEKADSIGCFASEFDVWLTADSVLIVNHDATINGYVIEDNQSAVILAQKLPNGENVPTLDAYLQAASPLTCRLVCELKEHDSKSSEIKAVKKIVAMIDKYGLSDRTDYITFSSDAFKKFIKQTRGGNEVYYLNGDYVPTQIKHMGGAGMDYHVSVFKKHPEWIDEAHNLGLKVNAWTVNKPEDMQWCIDHGVDFITTNDPELLQSILQNQAQ